MSIEISSRQQLKDEIQNLMIAVTGDSYTEIRTKDEEYRYYEKVHGAPLTLRGTLRVEANGSEINVSIEDYVSKFEEYLNTNIRYGEKDEELAEIIEFQSFKTPFKRNIKHEYKGKTMYCAVSMSISNRKYLN
ncbi:hypothetical protein [Pseudomonas sp. TNT2022 ID642]|uniref:hypothetical protein n=1 Tax=Pseudomonas sp. TNT2022 ID642 TaxID=2942632 RepID=UPI00236304DA|nr:hypothetical protein [Pseudomonas sp. TNT2022 ID642]MDD1004739.1 hypothetical protein [Pseudomonas sp. TNT2022 ID642]